VTLTDKAEFIALWNQGLKTTEIAVRLGMRGTISDRVMNS
jgi:hypothetical protein